MCKCAPDDPRPYCGKPGCEWPERPAPSELKQNTLHLFSEPERIITLCQHVANGGDVIDLCRMWHCDNFTVMSLIKNNEAWDIPYKAAREAHSDWLEDRLLGELKAIAFCDIREAYTRQGDLLSMSEMPESIARVITSLDVDEIREWDAGSKSREVTGYTKKIKLHSKLDAIKMLGDFRGMWRKVDIANAGKTLEDIIVGSREKADGKSATA